MEWQLYLPRLWTDEPDRCRRADVPQEVVHRTNWRLALGLLDTLAQWQLEAPVVVADAGYRRQHAVQARSPGARAMSWPCKVRKSAHPEEAEPRQPAYGGLGPPALPRYRLPPRALSTLAVETGAEQFSEVTWRQGSKGAMTSWFAVLTVRPAGKQSLAAAQESVGGRRRWDGILPTRTLLVEWAQGQGAPTDYWMSNLPATTPVADLVRWAKTRRRIEHDYRELKHGLGLDHFEGRTWPGRHHHVTLVTAAQAFLTLRTLGPKAEAPARASTRPSPPKTC
ncbi:transposase [Streptomyces griseorubiginosus]